MNRTTLYKSLEASNHYYDVMLAPKPSPREQIRAAKQQKIIGILGELKSIEAHLQALEDELGHKYRADQPRVPAGSSTGGQWTSGGGNDSGIFVPQRPEPTPGTPIVNPPSKPDNGSPIMNFDDGGEGDNGNPIYQGEPDSPIEPVYPLENLLGLWAGGEIFGALDIFGGGAAGVAEGGIDAGAEIGGEGTATSLEEQLGLQRPEGIPEDWEVTMANDGKGVKYIDPATPKAANSVRTSTGNPSSNFPSQQQPYAKWQVNGRSLDASGNTVAGNSAEAHIPLTDFKFDLEVFK